MPEGGEVGFQAPQEVRHFHREGYLAEPDVHAGFQLVEMALHTKSRMLHEVGRKKSCHGLHHPPVLFAVAVADSQLDLLAVGSQFHRRTVAILTLRVREGSVYGSGNGWSR